MTVNIKWQDLEYKLSKPVLDAMTKTFKFDKVTAVQNSVIPVFCKNYDVAVEVFPRLTSG
jgi:superfamily II DNA/RNA helicase